MTKKQLLTEKSPLFENCCFDLQFRKDTRHERPNSPTYYRWKVQFVVTDKKESKKSMEKIQKLMGCGAIHMAKNQSRFSVQNIEDIKNFVIPFFNKNKLSGNKKKDFDLWCKAVEILWQNKGKYIALWERNDLLKLTEIHKLSTQYKNSNRKPKWINAAQLFTVKQ